MKKLLFFVSIGFIIILLFITFESFFVVSTYPIYKKAEKGRILQITNKYDTVNGKHFFVRYKKEDKDIALITESVLEKHYEDICEKLNYFPKGKVPVIIYNNEEEFLNTIKLETDIPPLAAYYSGTINILSPLSGDKSGNNIEEIYEKTGPHIHEFTHFLIDEKTNGNYPMWLTEGISLYMERELLGIDWKMGKGRTKDIDIKRLNNDFDELEVDIAYRKSLEVVDNMIGEYGFNKFNLLLDDLGKGNNINNSVKKALKVDILDI